MKKLYCLLLAFSLVSLLPIAAQDAQPQEGHSPLNKEEGSEIPAALQEDLANFSAVVEEEIDPEEKAKVSGTETEKKTACINVSPSEQKASNKTAAQKSKESGEKEKLKKSPKCSKSKTKETETIKKKPKASSRVKLVSYRPGSN